MHHAWMHGPHAHPHAHHSLPLIAPHRLSRFPRGLLIVGEEKGAREEDAPIGEGRSSAVTAIASSANRSASPSIFFFFRVRVRLTLTLTVSARYSLSRSRSPRPCSRIGLWKGVAHRKWGETTLRLDAGSLDGSNALFNGGDRLGGCGDWLREMADDDEEIAAAAAAAMEAVNLAREEADSEEGDACRMRERDSCSRGSHMGGGLWRAAGGGKRGKRGGKGKRHAAHGHGTDNAGRGRASYGTRFLGLALGPDTPDPCTCCLSGVFVCSTTDALPRVRPGRNTGVARGPACAVRRGGAVVCQRDPVPRKVLPRGRARTSVRTLPDPPVLSREPAGLLTPVGHSAWARAGSRPSRACCGKTFAARRS